MLICGHTHNSYFPDIHEPPYFNDGCCVLPDAATAIEISGGKISLVKWSVQAQETGILWVKKSIIGGPVAIENYLLWARYERDRLRKVEEEERKNK